MMNHTEFQRQMRLQRLSRTTARFEYGVLLAAGLVCAGLAAVPTYDYLRSASAHLQAALLNVPPVRR